MVFSFTEKKQSFAKMNATPNTLETNTIQNELKCFDFGSSTSAEKMGFLKITKETKFEETTAYGWLTAPSSTHTRGDSKLPKRQSQIVLN
jgi:hypothetical protein